MINNPGCTMKGLNVEYIRKSDEFRLVKELGFNEILKFVMENIVIRNVFTIIYLVYNLLFIYLLIAQLVIGIGETGFTFNTFSIYFPGIMWGAVAGSLLIIPFHEGLHALAFLVIRARKIKFGADMKQMIFYATAADFVAGRKGFTLVALAPFAIINLFSIPLMLTGDLEIRLFITVMLLLHNVMCIGDFGMLSFFSRHKDKEMFTFDDLETKTAFFYERIKD
jgi:hypothetical protein